MRTDPYALWLTAAIKEAAQAEDSFSGKLRDAGEGLIAGADPTGAALSRLAATAEAERESEKYHKLVRNLGVAGGTVGGAILVPSLMSALYGGIMGVQQGKGVRGKAVGGAASAVKGVWGRLSGIPKGRRAKAILDQAQISGAPVPLDDRGRKVLQWFADRAPISSMAGHPVPAFKTLDALTPAQAEILRGPAQSAVSSLITQTTVGGVLGGLGSYGNYRRGRKAGTELRTAFDTPVSRRRKR